MAYTQHIQWQCDVVGCGTRITTKADDPQPSEWTTVRWTAPPMGDPLASHLTNGRLLCPAHTADLADFLNGKVIQRRLERVTGSPTSMGPVTP